MDKLLYMTIYLKNLSVVIVSFHSEDVIHNCIKSITNKIASPGEAWNFWESHIGGFRRPCKDLTSNDVSRFAKDHIPNILNQNLTHKRNRMLIKLTGWSRIGYLHEIFPEAKFIHIVRDGRSVVNSLLNEPWWWGWRGPENWRWGVLSEENQAEWERHEKSFVALGAIEYKIITDSVEESKTVLRDDQYMQIRYEDFCGNPIDTMKNVCSFSNLEWSEKFERQIQRFNIKSQNFKASKIFTNKQIKILEEVLHKHLKRYKYIN